MIRSQRLGVRSVRRQRGVALVVSLVFLLVLTIIGVTAMQSATLQERMAGNARDRNVAFQAGERALRAAEADIDGGLGLAAAYVFTAGNGPDWSGMNCTGGPLAGSVEPVDITGDVPSIAANPCYFMEQNITPPLVAGSGAADVRYQITAVASGRSPDTGVAVRSFYRE